MAPDFEEDLTIRMPFLRVDQEFTELKSLPIMLLATQSVDPEIYLKFRRR